MFILDRDNIIPTVVITLTVGVVVFIAWAIFSAIGRADVERMAHDKAKLAWFNAHACAFDGYVAGRYEPYQIYRCDDGRQYIWRDIPTQ